MMARIAALIGLMLAAVPALAMGEVAVPPECAELAAREGFPTDVLSDRQVRAAKVRMAWLRLRHPHDPLVRKCRAAVRAATDGAAPDRQAIQ